MKNHETKRVLSRSGARELTPEEMEHVSGGVHTPPSARLTLIQNNPMATSESAKR